MEELVGTAKMLDLSNSKFIYIYMYDIYMIYDIYMYDIAYYKNYMYDIAHYKNLRRPIMLTSPCMSGEDKVKLAGE